MKTFFTFLWHSGLKILKLYNSIFRDTLHQCKNDKIKITKRNSATKRMPQTTNFEILQNLFQLFFLDTNVEFYVAEEITLMQKDVQNKVSARSLSPSIDMPKNFLFRIFKRK